MSGMTGRNHTGVIWIEVPLFYYFYKFQNIRINLIDNQNRFVYGNFATLLQLRGVIF